MGEPNNPREICKWNTTSKGVEVKRRAQHHYWARAPFRSVTFVFRYNFRGWFSYIYNSNYGKYHLTRHSDRFCQMSNPSCTCLVADDRRSYSLRGFPDKSRDFIILLSDCRDFYAYKVFCLQLKWICYVQTHSECVVIEITNILPLWGVERIHFLYQMTQVRLQPV